jgi:hypothetical protein
MLKAFLLLTKELNYGLDTQNDLLKTCLLVRIIGTYMI